MVAHNWLKYSVRQVSIRDISYTNYLSSVFKVATASFSMLNVLLIGILLETVKGFVNCLLQPPESQWNWHQFRLTFSSSSICQTCKRNLSALNWWLLTMHRCRYCLQVLFNLKYRLHLRKIQSGFIVKSRAAQLPLHSPSPTPTPFHKYPQLIVRNY
jgi:hypothetical protein